MTALRTDTVRIEVIDGELAAPPRPRRPLWQRIATSPFADDLRQYEFGVGVAVGLLLAVALIVCGCWLHDHTVAALATGGAR